MKICEEKESVIGMIRELFDIAWELNKNEETRCVLSTKTTSYMPLIEQSYSALCDLYKVGN